MLRRVISEALIVSEHDGLIETDVLPYDDGGAMQRNSRVVFREDVTGPRDP